ncbi:MAG: thiol:disulfide interchange protein DsbG [Acetobacteraceae bacterium]
MRGLLCLTAAALLASGVAAHAAGTNTMAPQAAAQILNRALRSYGTFQVLHTAPGPAGMTAALVSSGKHEAIVWIVGNGQAVLLGRIVGPDGQDLSREAAVTMGVVPKALSPAEIAAELATHKTFLVGDHGPELTAFMDPNCIWCHKLYEDAQPVIAAGKLRLRVVLVGIIKPSSAAKAVTILAAKDPARALALDELHFDEAAESGGIAPAKTIPPELGAAIRANTELLQKTGEAATPTLLLQNRAGEWKLMHGLPQGGLKAIMAEMATGKTAAAKGTAGQATPAAK